MKAKPVLHATGCVASLHILKLVNIFERKCRDKGPSRTNDLIP